MPRQFNWIRLLPEFDIVINCYYHASIYVLEAMKVLIFLHSLLNSYKKRVTYRPKTELINVINLYLKMSFSYWLDEIGFISRQSLKEIIQNPEYGFTGFKRYSNGNPGAYCFVCYQKKTIKLDVLSIAK